MKQKIYITFTALCVGLLISNGTSAQWTRNAGTKQTYLTFSGDSVGIGTSTPTFKLDVQATGVATMQFKSGSDNASILLDRGASNKTSSLTYRSSGSNLWQTGIIGNDNYNIRNNGLAAPAITVLFSNNNVGLGITNPSERLEVNGNIKASGRIKSATLLVGTDTGATGYVASIKGKLIAEEVRVDLKAAWPDYVFSNEYKLMSLEELEANINTYQHLPGIPSADEIKNSGITLGEMQTKTIEKVEELTLYLIQLKEENNELRNRIEALEKK